MNNSKSNFDMKCCACGNSKNLSMGDDVNHLSNKSEPIKIKCLECGRTITLKEYLEENGIISDCTVPNSNSRSGKNYKRAPGVDYSEWN